MAKDKPEESLLSSILKIEIDRAIRESEGWRYQLLNEDMFYLSIKLGIPLPSNMNEEDALEAWDKLKQGD